MNALVVVLVLMSVLFFGNTHTVSAFQDCGVTVDFVIGHRVRVTLGGVPNRLRSGPGTNYQQVGTLQPGQEMAIIGSPVCSGGYQWWEVNAGGQIGWTAAGGSGQIWLEPPPARESGYSAFVTLLPGTVVYTDPYSWGSPVGTIRFPIPARAFAKSANTLWIDIVTAPRYGAYYGWVCRDTVEDEGDLILLTVTSQSMEACGRWSEPVVIDPQAEVREALRQANSATVYDSLPDFPSSAVVIQYLERQGYSFVVNTAQVAAIVVEGRQQTIQAICIGVGYLSSEGRNTEEEALLRSSDAACVLLDLLTNLPFGLAGIVADYDIYIDSWYWPLHNYVQKNVSIACFTAYLLNLDVRECEGGRPR